MNLIFFFPSYSKEKSKPRTIYFFPRKSRRCPGEKRKKREGKIKKKKVKNNNSF
jgi:hypothetical protein